MLDLGRWASYKTISFPKTADLIKVDNLDKSSWQIQFNELAFIQGFTLSRSKVCNIKNYLLHWRQEVVSCFKTNFV